MCGRYFFDTDEYGVMLNDPESPVFGFGGGEIYPSADAPILLADNTLALSRWGKAIEWGRGGNLLHARSETVQEKPTFRNAFQNSRCMIPTSGYYEWNHVDGKSQRGQKYFFYDPDSPRLYLAGLALPSDSGLCFVIITREAGAFMTDIHDRMPQTLARDQVNEWLRDTAKAQAMLLNPQAELARTYQGS